MNENGELCYNTTSCTGGRCDNSTITLSLSNLETTTNWCVSTIHHLMDRSEVKDIIDEQNDVISTIGNDISSANVRIDLLEEDNRKLRQQLSLLSTRVNDILAFFQKNNINIKE